MIEASELVQASSIMVAQAMLGDLETVERGIGAYAAGLRLVDRAAAFDVIQLMPAVSAVMMERWDMLAEPLERLHYCAARGSSLAAAVVAAIDEERSADEAGREQPAHRELQALGYLGISQLLRYRTRTGLPVAA
jgi:hypothetical protein